jgi:hypothetical protein
MRTPIIMLMLTRISKRLSHSYDEIKRNIEIKVEKITTRNSLNTNGFTDGIFLSVI